MPKRILYSGFKWPNVDDQSGYQHVVPEGSDYVDGGRLWGGKARFRSMMNRINLLLTDIVTCCRGIRYDYVFIFHPEHSVYVSPFILRSAGVKVIYAVHIDEHYWFGPTTSIIMKLKRWQAKFVSHFVVLSNVQAAPFRTRFGNRVTFIPHGIWNNKKILLTQRPSFKIMVIGNSYRDYDLLINTATLFNSHHPEIVFNLVGVDKAEIEFRKAPRNIVMHPRLDSEEYFRLMASSEFIFLPLTYAAANNALLEGLSIGIPVFCNNVEGVKDYLPSEVYIISRPEELLSIYLKRMKMTDQERIAEQHNLKKYSQDHFEWSVIHDRIAVLCETL